ncbi:unnamed protein product [Calypogeia fissa]
MRRGVGGGRNVSGLLAEPRSRASRRAYASRAWWGEFKKVGRGRDGCSCPSRRARKGGAGIGKGEGLDGSSCGAGIGEGEGLDWTAALRERGAGKGEGGQDGTAALLGSKTDEKGIR